MATNVTFNGNTYSVPQVGDSGWGSSLTNYLVAIASGALQKTGGAYTLSAEVDFGTGFGLKSLYFKSRGASVSSTGIVRMANAESIAWRNAANSADLALTVNSSDELQFGGANVIVGGLGTITNSDISASAAIAFSKLAPLANGTVLMGSPSNVAASYTLDGDVLVGPGGTTSINAGVIVNADINASAAIARSKLDFGSGLVNADLSSSAAIALSKLAAVTASRALVSDGSGFVSASSVTATELGRLSGLGSAALGLTDTQSPTNKTFNDTSNVVLVGGNSRGAAMRVGTNDAASLFLETNGVDRFQLMDTANLSTGDAGFFGTAGLIVPAGTTAQRPSSPSNGTIRLNTDTGEFEGRAAGAWQSVGGGVNERPEKNYLKAYATAAVAPGTLATLASATANIATTSGLFHADSGSGAAALAQSTDTSLRGATNYNTTAFSSSSAGAVFVQFPAVALEAADLGKPVSISFDVTGVTTSGDWDVVVVRYNASGTYQELIPVAGTASGSSVTPSARLPTGTAQFRGFFVPTSDSGHLYALRFRRLSGSTQIRLDTLYVGPQVQLAGAAVTTFQTYTPTTQGFGTVSGMDAWWRQVGDTLHVYASFTPGTTTATEAQFGLPNGVTIDLAKQPTATKIKGKWWRGNASATSNKGGTILATGNQAYVRFGIDDYTDSQNPSAALNGNALVASGQVMYLMFEVPIANWSSSVTMAERAVEEYASNSSTTDADDTTSFAYGIDGSVVPSISGATNRNKRSRFQTPIQPTDSIVVEVKPGASGEWSNSLAQDGANIGITWTKANTTDVDVTFGFNGNSPNNAFGTATWATRNASSWRWRVRKVSGGAAVGYPVGARNVVGDISGTAVPAGYIGERLTAANTTGSNAVANTAYSSGTVTLTPGVYDLYGMIGIVSLGTLNTVIAAEVAVRDATSTSFTGTNTAENRLGGPASNGSGGGFLVGPWRVNVTATTTYHAVGQIYATSGTGTANLRIIANRVG